MSRSALERCGAALRLPRSAALPSLLPDAASRALCGALLASVLLAPLGARAQPCIGDCDGDGAVVTSDLVAGVAQALGEPAAEPCAAFDADGDQRVTVAELVTAVNNALFGCPPETVPFTAALDPDGPALLLTPTTALRGDVAYAIVLTDGITDPSGRPLQPSNAFKALLASTAAAGDGPVARFEMDPEEDGNPYPDSRLIAGDGVHIPDRFALRGLPDMPELATARAVLRATADAIGAAGYFSTTAPIRLPVSGTVDVATVGPETVKFFARRSAALDLASVVADAARLGVPRTAIALALAFPTQTVEAGLLAVRDRLDERAAAGTLRANLVDEDEHDDLVLGVFQRGAPEFADFFTANPAVATLVHGLLPSPDFRGGDGIFAPDKLSGTASPTDQPLDFYLTLPAGPGPHRAVVLQHGFGGDNRFVLSVANELATAGLAGIGISAVSHGRRGSPLDLLSSTPLQLRDILRQTVADQLALTRAVAAGIDTDGDGAPDVGTDGVDYLGVSLGGILGAVYIAVEPSIQTAVLNVAGGRVAFLGDNPGTRPIYTRFLAAQAALDLQSPEFEVFLQRMLALGQQALDPADPLNFGRRWSLDPFPGFKPRRVLLQEGIGDQLVSNASTEALATAGGLAANGPVQNPDGASGLWRFEPPGGHGIFGRADVREQALRFLVSDGTEIVGPAAERIVAPDAADHRF